MTTTKERLQELNVSPYAWPGGYAKIAVMDDGECLCRQCTIENRDIIEQSTGGDGWALMRLDINWEDDSLYCSHCNTQLTSEYGETE